MSADLPSVVVGGDAGTLLWPGASDAGASDAGLAMAPGVEARDAIDGAVDAPVVPSAPQDAGSAIPPDAPIVADAPSAPGQGAPTAPPASAPSDAGRAPAQAADASAPSSCALAAEARLEDVSTPTTVVGSGTPASCTAQAFVAAVAKGGIITFDCGPSPVTITLDQPAKVYNDRARKVVIDGGGRVTLSGAGRTRILYQNTCDPQQVLTSERCHDQEYPELTVQNLTFVDGDASATREGGGAIFALGGRLKIVNSHFRRNRCSEVGTESGGGAVRALQQHHARPVYIVGSTFGGSAEDANVCSNGGAVSGTLTSISVFESTFIANRAVGRGASPPREGLPGGGSGGAVYLDGYAIELALCSARLEYNSANEGGGAVFFVSNDKSGHVRVEDSTLLSNLSRGFESQPGMFVLAAGAPTLVRSVLR